MRNRKGKQNRMERSKKIEKSRFQMDNCITLLILFIFISFNVDISYKNYLGNKITSFLEMKLLLLFSIPNWIIKEKQRLWLHSSDVFLEFLLFWLFFTFFFWYFRIEAMWTMKNKYYTILFVMDFAQSPKYDLQIIYHML